jgi:hypothetical protein
MFFYSEATGSSGTTDPIESAVMPDTYDPYFANVSLLLKADGANNSTTFVDSSPNNLTISRFGETKISTVNSKYGSSSIYFDGNGDYLTVPSNNNLNFGTGSFTIEMWINPTVASNTQQKYLFGKRANVASYNWMVSLMDYVNNSTTSNKYRLYFYASFNGTSWGISKSFVGSQYINPNVWTHLAYVRNGSDWKAYINGIGYSLGTSSDSISFDASAFGIGTNTGGAPSTANSAYRGYIDDLRVTKGVARYTTNFTPPNSLHTTGA